MLFLFACLVAIGGQVAAQALPPEQVKLLNQGVDFFNYENCGSATATGTGTSTSVVINDAAAKKAAQKLETGNIKIGYALYDSSGNLRGSLNKDLENYGASITKSLLLVAYLNQVGSAPLSSSADTNLTQMIEASSDPAANNVYGMLNNPRQEVAAVVSAAGMTGFKYNDTGDSLYYLGQSQITADGFAKYFSKIFTLIKPANKVSYAQTLLSTITPQAGILQAGLPGVVYSKEGWKPEPWANSRGGANPNPFGNEGAPYVVNQAAQFSSGGTTYGVAVTVSGTSDESSGETIIKNIVSALVTSGGQSTQSQNSSCCVIHPSGNPTATTAGGTGGFALNQVTTFASEPVTSTWNIPNSTVEQWFLKQAGAQATIAKYGLNSSNIGKITSAVEAAKVSPVFFYLYTVNEGGGDGGFINHYSSDIPGGGPANAKRDATYLASASRTKSSGPATGGGEPSDMPTAEAKQILNALPLGSIGVAYIQATSAVTAELEDLSGKTGDWSGLFNKPLSAAMQNIKTMGGDPSKGGSSISTGSCTIGVSGQGIAKAVNWAVMIANNNGYGYDQPTRTSGWTKWKSDPSCTHQCGSFDCSSFISAALTEAGYFKTNPNFATGNEVAELTSAGFKKIANSATSSAGLQAGDILVWNGHTEMYIGNNKAVAAHINELGTVSGGQVGDQTGQEISVTPFGSSLSTDPWIGIYRAP